MSQLANSLVKVGTLLFLTQSPQVLLMAVKCHHLLHRDPRASCSKARWTLPVCVAVPSDHSPACSGPTRPLVTSGSLDPWLPAGCGSWEPQQLLRGREGGEPGEAWSPQLRPSPAGDPLCGSSNHRFPCPSGPHDDSSPLSPGEPPLPCWFPQAHPQLCEQPLKYTPLPCQGTEHLLSPAPS